MLSSVAVHVPDKRTEIQVKDHMCSDIPKYDYFLAISPLWL